MSTRGMMITVHMLLPVYDPITGHDLRDPAHAADYVSAMLNCLERNDEIMDWGYARNPESGEHLYARPFDMEGKYSEGDFLAEADKMDPPQDPPSLLEASKNLLDSMWDLYVETTPEGRNRLDKAADDLREAIAREEEDENV